MEKTMLKKAAIQSVALMLGVMMLSYGIKHYNAVAMSASDNQGVALDSAVSDLSETRKSYHETEPQIIADANNSEENVQGDEGKSGFIFMGAKDGISSDIVDKLGEQYLVIKKPRGESLTIQLEDLYITKHLKVVLSGFMEESTEVDFIGRINGEEVFVGEPVYSATDTINQEKDGTDTTSVTKDYGNDPVNGIEITSRTEDSGYHVDEILLQLNHVYVHIVYEDDNYYYIDLKRPRDVYDKILVIDAGHGGKDPGALSKDEFTYEKEINLKILSELKELLDKDDIKVYYTKLEDATLFLRPRVTLANDVDCDFFISIHNNANDSTKVNGTEILYYNDEYKNIKIKDMAKIFSDELSKAITLKNGGLVQMKNGDIFILSNARVPAIIIEAGYMTNNNDLTYIKSRNGQKAIAQGIYNGIWCAYEELMPQTADE